MKLLISSLLLLLSIGISSAYASGSGVGPRPMSEFSLNNGGATVGGGDRPDSLIDRDAEMVRLVGQTESGAIVFKYKAAGDVKVQMHAISVDEFAPSYLEAIKRSQASKTWESVVSQ